MDAARTYVASEEASELQLKPGRKKDERFEGTIARLHLVETKDDKTLASYKDNFNIQRQDALMLHTYAERILTDIKQYETRTHEHKLDPTTPPASFDDIRRIEQNLARFFSRSQ